METIKKGDTNKYFKYLQFKGQNVIALDSKKVFCPLCDSYGKQ